jgi:hypothetical protein
LVFNEMLGVIHTLYGLEKVTALKKFNRRSSKFVSLLMRYHYTFLHNTGSGRVTVVNGGIMDMQVARTTPA